MLWNGISHLSTGAKKSSDSQKTLCDSGSGSGLKAETESGLRSTTRKAALEAKQKMSITEELSGKLKYL